MTEPETIARLEKELVEYRESLRHAHECYRGLEQQQIVAAQRLEESA